MIEVVVISGKGGTGKTTVVASLAALARNAVLADCDVDAPDLHLLLKPEVLENIPYAGSEKAEIDPRRCTGCGACVPACRFDAVEKTSNGFRSDPLSCEGCGACAFVCPAGAIQLKRHLSGWIHVSRSRYGPFVYGELRPGEEASGKLVTQVKMRAREIGRRESADLLLVDGAPGIGCPVIASLSGAHVALVVTEPSRSALHDLERVVAVARQFRAQPFLAINKADLAPDLTRTIESHAHHEGIPLLARIPYDEGVVEAMANGAPIVTYGDGPAVEALKLLWANFSARFPPKAAEEARDLPPKPVLEDG
ncbi:MAG: ATP-binding protein [Candidatus Bipolaricaulota bacterium]